MEKPDKSIRKQVQFPPGCSGPVCSENGGSLDGSPSPAVPGAQAGSHEGACSRRQLLAGLAGVPLAGPLALAALTERGWQSHEELQLAAATAPQTEGQEPKPDAITQPTNKFNWEQLKDLKAKVPHARLGKVELSRMILGGNLIGGWAHARDLIYVSKLVKAYHTREKIFETFRLAEACGVNAILTNPILCEVINDYWKHGRGEIQFISDCGGSDTQQMIQKSIDAGACACYIQGGTADGLVADGRFDVIEQGLELIRRNGLPAGIGAHKLRTVTACVEKGLIPDFWMKTLHQHNYWSARLEPRHDNIWCEEPEETIAYMQELRQPWIAFKTLAAGAIHPRQGFRYAFENGADFICVGMYDFQLVEDCNILSKVLTAKLDRRREWFA